MSALTEEKELLDDQLVQEEFERLLDDYLHSNHRRKVKVITEAFEFARNAHKGMRRRSGELFIMHPLAVARIVCNEMGLGSTSICSALLHDVVEDCEYTVEDIKNKFGDKIAEIVDGLTKIAGGVFGEHISQQAETFRKLLLTMNNDIRVILIKMADRLHNLRTLSSMPPKTKHRVTGETLFLYAPLAHRLGLFAIKTELEDLCFKYDYPKDYEYIHNKLKTSEESRQLLFRKFAKPVDKKLQEMELTYEMRTRVKSSYSIWNKMQKKNVPFEDIYDIFAVRIIFESKKEVDDQNLCFDIYSAITKIYRPRPDRFRDWVTIPKANGYQALHMTVMGPDGYWIEIQIRSQQMDEIDEKGFAAHWKYKEQYVEEDTELDKWLHTITEILESPDSNSLDFLDTLKMNLFASEIVVFTPKGDIKTMPKGATALDFAYELHTDIGNSCIAAKVNRQLVPLSHPLSSGDQVEILTSVSQTPNPKWLDFVTTAKAHQKLEAYLRRVRREITKKGEQKLIEAFKRSNIEPISSLQDKIAGYYGFVKREDLLYAIEKGDVTLPENIKNLLQEKKETPPKDSKKIPQYDRTKPYVLSEIAFNRNYVIANCCKPIPDEDVLGFINDDGTVTVHKRSCQMAIRLSGSFSDRILPVEWSSSINLPFEATLEIKGIDSIGVLNTITKTISEDFNVNILRLLLDTKDGVFEGTIKMLVHSVKDIQEMCQTISKIKNIQSVARIAD
ncbi:MAG: RelA/SpoT family protein [Tannerella sp.]|jgi:GTP pyrophosphokinase|nr:RelA/SpoT family protein [Tannerella sp.]